MERIVGSCTFEKVDAGDLLDAARTMKGNIVSGSITTPPGVGVDTILGWAIVEIESAAISEDPTEQQRFSSGGVLHARRALSCLVDWYLEGFGFARCADGPVTAEAKSELLLRRGVIDGLTSRVLKRAVDLRNTTEHEYRAPLLAAAEDAVELIRRTIQHIKQEHTPSNIPCFFGSLSYGCAMSSDHGAAVWFAGWSGTVPLFVLATFLDPPWFGVIEPSQNDRAHVRRAFYKDTELAVYEEILVTLEHNYSAPSSFQSDHMCRDVAIQAGLE